jgi:hypothetical protein
MSTPVIAYCKIFPAIGIARLGNSPDAFFFGPEAPGTFPDNGGTYKDSAGRVKRQAARFRIYGFDAGGQVVAELTAEHPDVASISWQVSLANKKAVWYRFNGAEDVAKILDGEKLRLRNEAVTGAKRNGLVIGPATARISGRSQSPEDAKLQGEFRLPTEKPKQVFLGELKTDAVGRLLVLGGRGESATVLDANDNPLNHYANNDGWHDDTSDGPVTAEIKLKDGSKLAVKGRAWVIVAPPHYSPHTENIVTLYDVIEENVLAHKLAWPESELGPKPDPNVVSFTRDIYPILKRLSMYQWVSKRAHRGHAGGKPGGFLTPEILKRLANPDLAKAAGSIHKEIFSRVRTPILHAPFLGVTKPHAGLLDPQSQEAINQANLFFMPPLAGDQGDVVQNEPKTWLSLTATQYHKLSKWKDGDFINDWGGAEPLAKPLSEIPIAHQPAALTRGTLEPCQGGAFYPGIEITSIVRFKSFYSEAFRVSDAYEAGDITKWMALPWQADFYECRDHWWPSIRPDDVVPVGEYEEILDAFKGEVEKGRLASLLIVRKPWARGVDLELPPRPGLPTPRDDDGIEQYQARCQDQLNRFQTYYLRIFGLQFEPGPTEDAGFYRRRVEEFLDRTILQSPAFQLPLIKEGESAPHYHARVQDALDAFLKKQLSFRRRARRSLR